MTNHSISNKWGGMGVVSAIAASLCCITPILAFLAGSSSLASAFSWIEPFRPYLIGVTVLIIGFAWYQQLTSKPVKEDDCGCEEDEKPSFFQSKAFLGIVTVFAGLMLAFPYYTSAFYAQPEKPLQGVQPTSAHMLVLDIQGMTCSGCEAHVEHAANEVEGIQFAKASYAEGRAEIAFDPALTNPEQIVEAVKTTGYKITDSKLKPIEEE